MHKGPVAAQRCLFQVPQVPQTSKMYENLSQTELRRHLSINRDDLHAILELSEVLGRCQKAHVSLYFAGFSAPCGLGISILNTAGAFEKGFEGATSAPFVS